jgi:hypothetical protein
MGTWGIGLWSDDTAADIRASYREALENGASDEEARTTIFERFASDLNDEEMASVVWLAFAAVQQSMGRLDPDVRTTALEIIETGRDLRRWEGSSVAFIASRRRVLDKLRDKLLEPPRPPRKIRRPAKQVTPLRVGDILGYRAPSNRLYLLAVRRLHETRYGCFPVVRLLEFQGVDVPPANALVGLPERPKASPGDPGWSRGGIVMHRRGHDYASCGFQVVASVDAEPQAPDPLESLSGWEFWQKYLNRQDELLSQRLAAADL